MASNRWSKSELNELNRRWKKLRKWAKQGSGARSAIAQAAIADLPKLKKQCCGKHKTCSSCPRTHAKAISSAIREAQAA